MSFVHETVLLHETVDAVLPRDGGVYVDCTLGGAGHSKLLLEQSAPSGRLLALDQDETALANAREVLRPFGNRVTLAHTNFREVRETAQRLGFAGVDGIIFDLGVSSPQFDEAERGFSYKQSAPLDMRMDRTRGDTAADLVNSLSAEELSHIFYRYGEEKFSRRVAEAIVRRRLEAPIVDTLDLAELVKEAIPAAARRTGPHPARRVFQALRIAVNDELGALEEALQSAFELLNAGGRMAIITFHSLEDRIVKHTFTEFARGCICPPSFPICRCGRKPRAALVTRKPISPSPDEIKRNSRARSAKLRVLEKLAP